MKYFNVHVLCTHQIFRYSTRGIPLAWGDNIIISISYFWHLWLGNVKHINLDRVELTLWKRA